MNEMHGSIDKLKNTQEFVLSSLTALAKLLKAISSESRLNILSLLLISPREFKDLKKQTELQKSALANHLNLLIDQNLVQKIQHGSYSITRDGKDILVAISEYYRHSLMYNKGLSTDQDTFNIAQSFLHRRKSKANDTNFANNRNNEEN
jgi:predicted transcriptional regulator